MAPRADPSNSDKSSSKPPAPCTLQLRWTLKEAKAAPSISEGLKEDEERQGRFHACDFARNLIRAIFNNERVHEQSSSRVQILACYYVQVFFMYRSLQTENAKDVAVAAAFLAFKVVDLPRKIRGILRSLNQHRVSIGEPELSEEEQKHLCERVLKIEFTLLRIVRFNFDYLKPLDELVKLAEAMLRQLSSTEVAKGTSNEVIVDAEACHELTRVSERFLIDCFMGFAPMIADLRCVMAGAVVIATRYTRREIGIPELCRLLGEANLGFNADDIHQVVNEILNVFRTKNQTKRQPSSGGIGVAAGSVSSGSAGLASS